MCQLKFQVCYSQQLSITTLWINLQFQTFGHFFRYDITQSLGLALELKAQVWPTDVDNILSNDSLFYQRKYFVLQITGSVNVPLGDVIWEIDTFLVLDDRFPKLLLCLVPRNGLIVS